jgi:chitin disaccharide deacetylase
MNRSDSVCLIVHADDYGLAGSVNEAVQEAFEQGRLTSASVMMPAPHAASALSYARRHSDLDLGVHLTLISEWPNFRLRPICRPHSVRTLVTPDGHLLPDTISFGRCADPHHAEAEMRAQVEACMGQHVIPTHLDVHMFSVYRNAEMFAAYERVSAQTGIPAMVLPQDSPKVHIELPTGARVQLDGVLQADRNLPPERWEQAHIRMLRSLRPGLYEWLVHPARDCAELRNIMDADAPWGATWRQRDLDLLLSDALGRTIEERGIRLVCWKEIEHVAIPVPTTSGCTA